MKKVFLIIHILSTSCSLRMINSEETLKYFGRTELDNPVLGRIKVKTCLVLNSADSSYTLNTVTSKKNFNWTNEEDIIKETAQNGKWESKEEYIILKTEEGSEKKVLKIGRMLKWDSIMKLKLVKDCPQQ